MRLVGSQYPQVISRYFLRCFSSTLTWTFCLPTAIWLSIRMRTARSTNTIIREEGAIRTVTPFVRILYRVYVFSRDLSRGKTGQFGAICKDRHFGMRELPKGKEETKILSVSETTQFWVYERFSERFVFPTYHNVGRDSFRAVYARPTRKTAGKKPALHYRNGR